jgi:hypothetical protein
LEIFFDIHAYQPKISSSNFKFESSTEAQIPKRNTLTFLPLVIRHSLSIYLLARSGFGEGRDFDI